MLNYAHITHSLISKQSTHMPQIIPFSKICMFSSYSTVVSGLEVSRLAVSKGMSHFYEYIDTDIMTTSMRVLPMHLQYVNMCTRFFIYQ